VQYTALVSILAFFSLSAHATPVVWNLSGVTFEDGGTASGSFTYDADTGAYSAISISTTAGTVITTAMDYDVTNAGCLDLDEIICFLNVADGPDYTGDLGVTFAWLGTPLTNAGGTVTLTGGREYTCENATCFTVGAPLRLLDAGSITTNPAAPTYSVGGNASGLTTNNLVLQNNGVDDLPVAADGSFTFLTELVDASAYAVTVSTQSPGQTCTVTNGSGVIAAADVTNVAVTCVDDEVTPTPAASIPTLSQWALIILSMFLGLMVFANRRRLFK
jgi:hypothetical protein